jgi:serine/threonine protein kinase
VPVLDPADEAAWAQLPADDGDAKFPTLVERFWKRKEIHEQTARSADELRAIEREAQAERAAAKAAPKPRVEDKDDYVRDDLPQAADDPKRAAREAEAKERREAQERLRAEEDARRAAQAEERAAKQKEDAERGAAVAESLKAMRPGREQLAEQPAMRARFEREARAAARIAHPNVAHIYDFGTDEVDGRWTAFIAMEYVQGGSLRPLLEKRGQCWPVADGPFSGPLHLRRSKLARWPLARAAQ